jgi:chemotaxis protein histidine kinase CheA
VYTENERKNTVTDSSLDSVDDAQEKSLRWLLEMDLDEPEEKLFSVSGNEYLDQGLSDYEAEVASRPMFRGSTTSDDLSNYVAEEIVISSEGEKSDIYSADQRSSVSDADESGAEECMAVDYSTGWQVVEHELLDQVVCEGEDILGLAADDDIGEKFIAIKRVKRSTDDAAAAVAAPAPGDETLADAGASVKDAPHDNTDLVEPVEYDLTGITPAEQPLALSEAPVPGLVAVPGAHSVANEDVIPGVEDAPSPVEPAAETASAEDVVAYISNTQPPVDDDAFDQYLLAGEHLQSVFSGQEELLVEPAQGVVSVDPSAGDFIDYHEDFLSMEGIDRGNVSAVAGVISEAMEEISQLARERIRERGLASEALAVDVMLGSDAESIKRCYAEGFEPVTAICRQLPLALRELQQPELDTIYLRLFNGQTNENWNDLFSVDPVMDEQDIDAVFDDLLDDEGGDVAPDQAEQTNGVDWLAVEGFGEDSLEQDFALGIDLPAVEQELDINEVFSGTGSVTAVADEICGVDVDEFDLAEPQEEPLENLTAAEPQASVEVQQEAAGASWCIPEGIAFNYSSQSSTEIFSDFLDAFIEESTSEVEKLEDAFGEWEKNPADEAAMAPVARTLHTIKGIAKGVGLQRYGTLIHNFETLLEAMPRPQEGLEGEYFRMVNAWLDAAVRGLEHVRENRCDVASEFPIRAVVEAPSQALAQEPLESQQEPQQVAEPAPQISQSKPAADSRQKKRDQQLADEGAKALAAQQSVRITAEKLDHLLNLTSQAQQLGVRSAQSSTRGKRAAAELQGRLSSVRAQIATIADRSLLQVNSRGGRITPDLDALEMDQYSELQEAASILREGVEDLADLVELANRQNTMVETLLKQQASVITSISSSIQAARVVPVSRLMPGLRRIVRTVSTDLNKSVSFKVLNEAGALDRDHYARCQIILEHMVRNAMDHGIETPEDRLAQGKPTAGRITIDVRKSGGDYIIRLSDDGRGIDPDAIRESAYKKRLDVDVDKLTDDQVMRLIFHKGFSTANTLSEISGRGVGMDIVMSELQQLGGDIQIQSTVGLGTCFEIRIPANVTVNGALLVAAGEQSYAIPLNGLIAVEQVPVQDFYRAVETAEALSLFDMDCEPAYLATLCQREPLPDRGTWGATVPVIIAGTEERYMAIAIDNVEEALELVVRSLGPQFSGVPGLAGAATTADGDAIVALDLNLLVGSVDAGGISTIAVERPEEAGLLALVVDDSRTQRMVATSQLDTVGVETVTAENGMVAIDLLNSTHRLPDVVLLDVEMPVQDGIETLREIRKSRRFGHLPVIMVTSRTGSKHRALAKEAGCNGYMGKPFNFQALVERISELTGHELHHS